MFLPRLAVSLHAKGVKFLAGTALALSLMPCHGLKAQQASGKHAPAQSSAAKDVRFAKAQMLLAQGNFDQARQELQEQLKLNPSRIEAWNLLGIAYGGLKDYPHAVESLKQALRLSPSSAKTHTNLGNLYVTFNQLELGEKEFRRALTLSPGDRDANYNLGLLLIAKAAPAAAIPYLERVHPPSLESRLNLIRAYLRAGRRALALKSAGELSAANQSSLQLHFTLGVLLAEEKQYPAAQRELELARTLAPENFEVLYNLGQSYLRSGEYQKAELELNRALKLKPDSAETLYLLGQTAFDRSRPLDALDLLMRAHKLAPDNADIIFLLARVSMTQNYYEDTIPLLESGIKIAPQRADLHAALGESYFMAGKTERAVEEFKRLIELDPSARSYTFMGLAYRHLGRFEEARKYFETGLKQDPHSASCLFNLGYIEERQGNEAKAEGLFQRTLQANPDYSEALLELANLRSKQKKFSEAAELLRRFVKLSRDPAAGYYKLAMVERSMHQIEAAERDLNVFQTLSKNSSTGPYPYQHLFEYLDSRSKLTAQQRNQLDVSELNQQLQKHPGQPQDLFLLAESYLKLGKTEEAEGAIRQLDEISSKDYRTQTGVGVLLARYQLYQEAIQHFQSALAANPDSDDVKFDLADAYFHRQHYQEALEAVEKISSASQDDAYFSLLGDIYAHLGDADKAKEIFLQAIQRNPDNDQYYLSLTLIELREGDLAAAQRTLEQGLARIPGSGKIVWGLGVVSALEGNTAKAGERLEQAVELLPEWAGSYSTLGVFYYETGQIDKAREVLNRFKGSSTGGLDVSRIEDALAHAPSTQSGPTGAPLPGEARQQLLQLALAIADKTL